MSSPESDSSSSSDSNESESNICYGRRHVCSGHGCCGHGCCSLYDRLSVQNEKDLVCLFAHPNSNAKLSVQILPSQKQQGSDDCGLFAIAYATEIACNGIQNISDVKFDQSQMRNFLVTCFENMKLEPFPKTTQNVTKKGYRNLIIDVKKRRK